MPKTSKIKTTIWDAISDLNYLNSGEGTEISEYRCTPESDYQELLRKGSTALFNHIATNHAKVALERMAMIPPKEEKNIFQRNILQNLYTAELGSVWMLMIYL